MTTTTSTRTRATAFLQVGTPLLIFLGLFTTFRLQHADIPASPQMAILAGCLVVGAVGIRVGWILRGGPPETAPAEQV